MSVILATLALASTVTPSWPPAVAPSDGAQAVDRALDRGDKDEAVRLLSEALGSPSTPREEQARLHLERAEIYVTAGRTDAALADLDAATGLDPTDPESAALKAMLLRPGWPDIAISDASWISVPSAAEISTFFPERATRAELGGHIVLRCVVDAAGTLGGCRVLTEIPEGLDFGAATLALSARFKMKPVTTHGAPTSGRPVVIPIRFSAPHSGAPTTAFSSYNAGLSAFEARDYARAYDALLRPTAYGFDGAEYLMGVLFLDGLGREQDCTTALSWFRRGAAHGNVQAAFEMGRLFQLGCGVRRDVAQAVAWYKGAGVWGDPRAWDAIGRIYADGIGVKPDAEEARKWMKRGADAGVLDAEVWMQAHPG